jgi:hypothetical protein
VTQAYKLIGTSQSTVPAQVLFQKQGAFGKTKMKTFFDPRKGGHLPVTSIKGDDGDTPREYFDKKSKEKFKEPEMLGALEAFGGPFSKLTQVIKQRRISRPLRSYQSMS